MSCPHCMRGDAQNKDITHEVIDRLFENVSGIGSIVFTGGEPTLNIDAILYVLEVCKKRDIPAESFYLVTNGKEVSDDFLIACIRWYAYVPSVPLGSVEIKQMYPLDFEEFLWATGISTEWIDQIHNSYLKEEALDENTHTLLLKRFQYYLLIGGLPEAINKYLEDRNITRVRSVHNDIHELYRIDSSQYDAEHKLKIRRIYDLIPSALENKKKRIVYKQIEDKKGKDFSDYADEFEYLANSGVALMVSAISNPHFPLIESEQKRLVKLYLNDVGLLTHLLYGLNVNAVLQNIRSINLGTVYELVVAQELQAHGFNLHYYDNKQKGEVDFLIDDYERLEVLPLEIKSGKDYTEHSALTKFLNAPDYGIHRAIVFSNERAVQKKKGVTYLPIYYCMFLHNGTAASDTVILPELEKVD